VPEIRTVSISSPAWRDEAINVLRTVVGITVISLLLAGMHVQTSEFRAPIYTYQVFFHQQIDEIQRMYRELASAFDEILAERTSSGRWPAVPQLVSEEVSPFAALPGALKYSWEMMTKSDCINYIGHPPDNSHPTFLLFIQENIPHPPGTLMTDFHRRLDDGSVLHFMVMFHMNPELSGNVITSPERKGWKQIILGTWTEQ
jgi:hypothetical protein